MPKKKSVKKVKKPVQNKEDNSKLYAFLATFLSIVGFIIALIAWRKDKYVMYYAKQSLVIFVISVIASILSRIFGWIFIIGGIISFALGVVVFILWLMSWIYALSGEKKRTPIVSDWADKVDL